MYTAVAESMLFYALQLVPRLAVCMHEATTRPACALAAVCTAVCTILQAALGGCARRCSTVRSCGSRWSVPRWEPRAVHVLFLAPPQLSGSF